MADRCIEVVTPSILWMKERRGQIKISRRGHRLIVGVKLCEMREIRSEIFLQ